MLCLSYQAYLTSRPPESEVAAIRLMIRLAEEFKARVHIVHVSSAEAVEAIAGAKTDRVSITWSSPNPQTRGQHPSLNEQGDR